VETAAREYRILKDGHSVCGRGVGRNQIQSTNCQKSVHKKCSGINNTTIKASKPLLVEGAHINQSVWTEPVWLLVMKQVWS